MGAASHFPIFSVVTK